MRTFVAIELSDAAQRAVAELQQALAQRRGIRLVAPAQCHLTLKFLGEIDERMRAEVAAALQAIRCPGFRLALTRLGAFPDARRPRVVWVGVSEPPELFELARAVDAATPRIAADKPFRPHVTIARVGGGAERIPPEELERAAPPCSFAAARCVLYRSVPGPGGHRYEVLDEVALG